MNRFITLPCGQMRAGSQMLFVAITALSCHFARACPLERDRHWRYIVASGVKYFLE
jgi:hypothetical protein